MFDYFLWVGIMMYLEELLGCDCLRFVLLYYWLVWLFWFDDLELYFVKVFGKIVIVGVFVLWEVVWLGFGFVFLVDWLIE